MPSTYFTLYCTKDRVNTSHGTVSCETSSFQLVFNTIHIRSHSSTLRTSASATATSSTLVPGNDYATAQSISATTHTPTRHHGEQITLGQYRGRHSARGEAQEGEGGEEAIKSREGAKAEQERQRAAAEAAPQQEPQAQQQPDEAESDRPPAKRRKLTPERQDGGTGDTENVKLLRFEAGGWAPSRRRRELRQA